MMADQHAEYVACPCGAPSDGWPSEDHPEELCQDCWEAQCSRSWWAMVRSLGA